MLSCKDLKVISLIKIFLILSALNSSIFGYEKSDLAFPYIKFPQDSSKIQVAPIYMAIKKEFSNSGCFNMIEPNWNITQNNQTTGGLILTGSIDPHLSSYTITLTITDATTNAINKIEYHKVRSIAQLESAAQQLARKMAGDCMIQRKSEKEMSGYRPTWSYVWRSLIFPGYGHYYAGESGRTMFYGGSFLFSLAAYAALYHQWWVYPWSDGRTRSKNLAAGFVAVIYLINVMDALQINRRKAKGVATNSKGPVYSLNLISDGLLKENRATFKIGLSF